MKKFLMIACMVLFSTSMFAQQGAMYVGGNLNYGMHSDYKNIGVGVKAQYEFIQNLRAEASANYFFKKDYCSMWDINANLHYLFRVSDKFAIYPLAGLTVLGTDVDVLGVSASDSDFGFNVGGGIEFPITDAIKINAEAKYQIVDDWDRPVLSVGIAFAL
ncbi:MAG: porin family protein [Prevotella sp.]|nr:porin family protein [Prevotella sp.]